MNEKHRLECPTAKYCTQPRKIGLSLFVPSRLKSTRGGSRIALEQRSDYPYSGEVSIRIRAERPQTFTLYLRVPKWAGRGTAVSLNGRKAGLQIQSGTFCALRREWKDGDVVEYSIARNLRCRDTKMMRIVEMVTTHTSATKISRGNRVGLTTRPPQRSCRKAGMNTARRSSARSPTSTGCSRTSATAATRRA